MTARDKFIEAVSAFLDVPKSLAGIDGPQAWRPGRELNDRCLKLPVEIDGVVEPNQQIDITYTPGRQIFSINVLYEKICVSRLDFDPYGCHTNHTSHKLDGLPQHIRGIHFHRWPHNLRFIKEDGSLARLWNAEEIDSRIRNFDDALRYFCDELNIALPNGHYIELPRELL